jgi:hypothetical protein
LSRTSFPDAGRNIRFFLLGFLPGQTGKPYDFQEIFFCFSAVGFVWELGANT